MITLSVEQNEEIINSFFEKSGIERSQNSLCLVANNRGKTEGYCLFDIEKERVIIRFIEPLNDLFLSDGILRSALHVAAERFVFSAYYSDTVPEEFFEKLNFIKNANEKELDMDKLFKSCNNCSKGE